MEKGMKRVKMKERGKDKRASSHDRFVLIVQA